MTTSALDRIAEERLIAVVRGVGPSTVVDVAEAIRDGGVGIIEVTADSPDAVESLERLQTAFSDLLLGAGTVLDVETLDAVTAAGARFVVSPVVDETVLHAATERGVPFVPGAFTPSEVFHAIQEGASAVKVFPARTAGPAHVSALRGPLGDVPLIPTGGIDQTNARAFIDAGALAVGVGGAIADTEAIAAGELSVIQDNAAALRAAVSDQSN